MRTTPLAIDTLSPGQSLRDRAAMIVRAYYWLAPAFIVLWLGFDIDLRYPFLDALPGARAALYGTQLGCGVLLAIRPRLAALVGSVESSLSIGLLIVTTWSAYFGMIGDGFPESGNPFTPEKVTSLVCAAGILGVSHYARSIGSR